MLLYAILNAVVELVCWVVKGVWWLVKGRPPDATNYP